VPSRYDPATTLGDIVNNAVRIDGYIVGLDLEGFERNHLVGGGVERCLERVCEAVYRLGPQAETLMPGQPWANIRSMGNRLRHAYDRIKREVIWDTIRYELPRLVSAARNARAALEPGATPTA
jgi:uncharacterized protein with HEPN domain